MPPRTIEDVDRELAGVAQAHSDGTGHETALLHGQGWLCRKCDADFEEMLLDHLSETDEHGQATTAPGRITRFVRRDLYTFSGHFRASSPEIAQETFVAMLAQLEDVDGGTLRGHRHPAGSDDYSTVFPAGEGAG